MTPGGHFVFTANRNTGAIARLWDVSAVPPRLFLEIDNFGPATVHSAVCCVSGFRWQISALPTV